MSERQYDPIFSASAGTHCMFPVKEAERLKAIEEAAQKVLDHFIPAERDAGDIGADLLDALRAAIGRCKICGAKNAICSDGIESVCLGFSAEARAVNDWDNGWVKQPCGWAKRLALGSLDGGKA